MHSRQRCPGYKQRIHCPLTGRTLAGNVAVITSVAAVTPIAVVAAVAAVTAVTAAVTAVTAVSTAVTAVAAVVAVAWFSVVWVPPATTFILSTRPERLTHVPPRRHR